jgi:hypothetical protein
MKTTKNNFLPIEEHPEEITVESYWKAGNGIMYLREALPKDHKENLWNWFKKTHPTLNPSYYGIEDPVIKEYEHLNSELAEASREDLIREIMNLRTLMEKYF